jgi:glycolate oxidase FAD binding subunit
MERIAPNTPEQLTDTLRWSLATASPLEITSGGSKQALGNPVNGAHLLEVSALRGIVSHEPGELVLTARAATPLAEIEHVLTAHRQHLAFEPPRFTGLLGSPTAEPTLGGIICAGFAGPRRPSAGSARDHLLGVTALSGRAELFKGGGKVVKNVTGYDIPKLLAGSHGTLAVLTEVTVKALPAPEDTRTLVIAGASAVDAVRAMTRAASSTAEVSGAAFAPAELRFAGLESAATATLLRLEGATASVTARLAGLRELLGSSGSQRVLEREASLALWRDVRDITPLRDAPVIWRICVPPAQGAGVYERLRLAIHGATALMDWFGGLLWLRVPGDEPRANEVRDCVTAAGGQAMLFRASAKARTETPVFQPQAAPLAALAKRVKAQFDPADLLNRGRMNY